MEPRTSRQTSSVHTPHDYPSVLEAIGNTPLVRIDLGTPPTVLAKLEYLNPGGSVKDRSALYMIEQAEKDGILKPGGTIIDASSGNHGVSVALIGALKGYKVVIAVSQKISKEKLQAIQAYGAQVIMCPATAFVDDPQSYHSQAMALHKATPNSFMPDQYFNVVNRKAHETLLGPEIWEQTHGTITHFIAAAGTGGTVSGVGTFLKKQNPNIKIIAVDAATSYFSTHGNPKPYKVEGMGIDFTSDVLDHNVLDEIITATDEEALGMLKPLARHKGLLVGPTSGAVAFAAKKYTQQLPSTAVVAIIFGDSGRAYLTRDFYGDE